ncbi:MAG: ABC transporter permease [Planctomycetota bacterium]
MTPFLKSLAASRTLLSDFVRRDLRARYVGSSMGFFWSVIFPLINLFTFMFVFRIILSTRWGDEQGALEVSLVMLAGIVVWTGFSEAISRAAGCIPANANLVEKVVFPAPILPTYITLSALANMCLGLPIVLGATFWFGHVSAPRVGVEVDGGMAVHGIYEGYEPNEDVRHWPRARIALDRAWREDKTFEISWSGTATRGVDYVAPHDVVTVPAGSARLYLPIFPVRDDVLEGDETIEITLDSFDGLETFATVARFELHDNELSAEEIAKTFERDVSPYISESSADHHPLSLGTPVVIAPLLVLLLSVATVGIGSFFAAFNLFWRDTMHLIGVGLTVWMFATPIFYPAGMIPPKFSFMLTMNPMHWFIDMFRDVMLFARWPDPVHLGMFGVFAAVVFWLGTRFFARHQPNFPDLL